jgi:mono/diheme cytochrome c family protein
VRAALLAAALLAAACAKTEAANQSDLAAEGARVFAAACARCHGPEGAGGVAAVPGAVVPRNFRDASFHAQRTDAALRDAISRGTATGMPPFAAAFSPRELDALVAHIRSLDPRRR